MAWRWEKWGPPRGGGCDDQPAAKLVSGEAALRMWRVLQAERRAQERDDYAQMSDADVEMLSWMRKTAAITPHGTASEGDA